MSKWAELPRERHQLDLIAPSLDEQIGKDHGIRIFDELLLELDWSSWEAKYTLDRAGRPPIHPRLVGGAILYGLLKKIQSTRNLEEATMMRLDFQWFLGGLVIDHTTFCIFRQQFNKEIEDLFRQLNAKAVKLRKATLDEILIDGTRIRADSDRHGARTSTALDRKRKVLEEEIIEALKRLSEEGETISQESREVLEKRLEKVKRQKEKIEKALKIAQHRDKKKRRKEGKKAKEVRVPVSDPESTLAPNKEGGYAPNYTPVVAVDQKSGLIVGACIAKEGNEADTVSELIEQVQEVKQTSPKRVLCDGAFNSGTNMETLENDGIEIYTPVGANHENNPARRPDGRVPVPESKFDELPMRGKKVARAAFVYDDEKDCYYCPMGRELPFFRPQTRTTGQGDVVSVREYRSKDCSACPLSSKCIKGKAKVRTVSRDQYEELREYVGRRMSTEEGRQIYSHRAPGAEGAFAQLKGGLEFRRFSRRGHKKVKADWLWICMAHNLMKLIKSTKAEKRKHQGTTHKKGQHFVPYFALSMHTYEDEEFRLAA